MTQISVGTARIEMKAQELVVGDKVQGGHGEDHDTGVVHEIKGTMAFVAWQSGVSTWTPIEDLSEV